MNVKKKKKNGGPISLSEQMESGGVSALHKYVSAALFFPPLPPLSSCNIQNAIFCLRECVAGENE